MEQAELTPLMSRNSDISKRFSKVIEKALAVHPDDRFQTAGEFKQALIDTIATSKRGMVEEGILETDLSSTLDDSIISEALAQDEDGSDAARSGQEDSDDFDDLHHPPSRPVSKKRRGFLSALVIVVILIIVGSGIVYLVIPTLPDRILGGLTAATGTVEMNTPEEPTSTVETVVEDPTDTPEPSPTPVTPAVTEEIDPTTTPTIEYSPTVTNTPPPAITPVGGGFGQIAFASDRTGIPQIWIVNVDGTGLRQLTNSQWGACQPDWSPDGERLVFISPCEENKELYDVANLFIINADGTGLETLSAEDGGGFDPAWSPDGKSILFTSIRNNFRPQIFAMNLATKKSYQLSEENLRDSQPEWYPDGSKILFVTTRNGPYQIWTMNPDGTEQERFSASGSLWNTYPVWSPDGTVIIYTQRPQGEIPRLMGATYPDGGAVEFEIYTVFGSNPMREADISPDGHWLAFESWTEDSQHDIYFLRSSGSDLTQLTFDEAFDFDPVWRPIGP